MTGSTEVRLTSSRSARWQKAIVGFSLVGTVTGAIVSIATDPQWWTIVIWGLVSLILIVILVGLWVAADADAQATKQLVGSGVVTRADVISSEVDDSGDDVSFVLTLQIRPAGREAFTVTHHCSNARCTSAAKNAPTTITALVDASTRTWAVMHTASAGT